MRAELRAQLLDAGEELAAQLLDYHDRERKPIWWAFFDRIEMTPAELVEDAESIGRTELVGGPEPVKKSQAYVLSFPRRSTRSGTGRGVIDPATRDSAGEIIGARPRGAPAHAQARAVARGRAAARGAHPGQPVSARAIRRTR